MRKKGNSSNVSNGSNRNNGTLEKREKKPVVEPKEKLHPELLSLITHPEVIEQVDGQLNQRELLQVLNEVRNGNFTVRMPIDQVGISGKICDTLNEIISMNERMMQEFTKAGNTIGKQGKLTQRIEIPHAKGPGAPVLIRSIHLFLILCILLLKLHT